jgi:hypothetical protein
MKTENEKKMENDFLKELRNICSITKKTHEEKEEILICPLCKDFYFDFTLYLEHILTEHIEKYRKELNDILGLDYAGHKKN